MGDRRESGIVADSLFFFYQRSAMTRDDQETVTLNDPTAWQETAMPATASVDPVPPDPRVRVSQDDLMAAVHGGVITGAQATALWLRWSDPGQAAAQGPGQRAMPEPVAAEQPAPGSGRGTVVTAVLVVVAAAAGWVLHSLMR